MGLNQCVGAGLVDERVEARAARHHVVTGAAVDPVGKGGADDGVIARTRHDLQRQQIAARHAARIHRVVAALAIDHESVAFTANAVVDGELPCALSDKNPRTSRIRSRGSHERLR